MLSILASDTLDGKGEGAPARFFRLRVTER